ncbi:MAG: alpha/beta fold hydrolase [Gammaproteobacteria bacterium]
MLDTRIDLLTSLNHRPFKPLALFKTGHQQTLAAVFWPTGFDAPFQINHIIELGDGDRLSLLENTTSDPNAPICLLVHGLTGSHRSNYMVRLTRKLVKAGYRACRLNLRGCGTGIGLAQHPYHSGRSDDLKTTLAYLSNRYPGIPIHILSFSLGANLALKMTGEMGGLKPNTFVSLSAISPPLDLYASVRRIGASPNRIYDQYFAKALVKSVEAIEAHFPELSSHSLAHVNSIFEFDDIYTAPINGFKDARDYYTRCSSQHFISDIRVPTLILHAKDDPLVSSNAFKSKYYGNPHLHWILTQHGGHVGFLGATPERFSYQWMDSVLLSWISQFNHEK